MISIEELMTIKILHQQGYSKRAIAKNFASLVILLISTCYKMQIYQPINQDLINHINLIPLNPT